MPRQEAKRARFDSEPMADTREGVEAPFEKSEEDTLLQKCNGVFTEELICIEVFAGSARLSQAVTKVALQAMAIDHTISKAAKQRIVIMDLSKEHGIAELRGYIKANSSRIIWIHFAPPCGRPETGLSRSGLLKGSVCLDLYGPQPGLMGSTICQVPTKPERRKPMFFTK